MSDKIARRDFLGTAALVGAAAGIGQNFIAAPLNAATDPGDSIITALASELADAIRTRKLSSKTVVEAHLAQIAKVNPKLNAVVQLTADAREKRQTKPTPRWRAVTSRARCMACR
jgi:amidase